MIDEGGQRARCGRLLGSKGKIERETKEARFFIGSCLYFYFRSLSLFSPPLSSNLLKPPRSCSCSPPFCPF